MHVSLHRVERTCYGTCHCKGFRGIVRRGSAPWLNVYTESLYFEHLAEGLQHAPLRFEATLEALVPSNSVHEGKA